MSLRSMFCLFSSGPFTQVLLYVQISKFVKCKIGIISLLIGLKLCFGCSKELSHRDGSSEYP